MGSNHSSFEAGPCHCGCPTVIEKNFLSKKKKIEALKRYQKELEEKILDIDEHIKELKLKS